LANTIPSTITGPPLLMDPPLALTPLTVGKSRAVLYSHRILPSRVEYARSWPSMVAENTTPGMAVTAAGWAGLQGFLSPPGGGKTFQRVRPVGSSSAANPPLASGFAASLYALAA